MPTILILGGYGNAGRQIARYLLTHSAVDGLLLAGPSGRRARTAAQGLRREFPGRHIEGLTVDARNRPVLTEAFCRADCIVNAASTVDYTENIVAALLESGRDYLDTQLSSPAKLAVLRRHADRLAAAGICCITDGGFHPGLPGALVRYAAGRFDHLYETRIFSAINVNWKSFHFSAATRQEMVDEFRNFQPLEFRRGRWRARSWFRPIFHSFAPPFGRRYCVPMHLAELEALPDQLPELRNLGFYVTGFNPLLDYVLMPLITLGAHLLPRRRQAPLGRLLEWGLRFSSPPYGVELVLVAGGQKYQRTEELTLRLNHTDPYAMTAIPVAACLLQWLRGDLRRPGLHHQALIVDPTQLIADMRRLGLQIDTRWEQSSAAVAKEILHRL